MHPLLAYGAMVLVGYFLEQKTLELRAAAEQEKRRLNDLEARRSRTRRKARNRARVVVSAATNRMIETLKSERRAAAEARGQLPWGSSNRKRAHDLVLLLNQRIDALYAKKQSLHADNHV